MPRETDEQILKYQQLYMEGSQSRVFAPLAEAYRQRGRMKEALHICKNGIKRHPNFIGAHVILGRIYLDSQKEQEACQCFIKAIQLAPENLLAHSLLARCWLRLKQPQKALKSLKTILFLNPRNEQIQKAINQLESSKANKNEDPLFSFLPDIEKGSPFPAQGPTEGQGYKKDSPVPPPPVNPQPLHKAGSPRDVEKYLSLIDALISLGERDKALAYLKKIEEKWSQHRGVRFRRQALEQNIHTDRGDLPLLRPEKRHPQTDKENQIRKLENLLLKVQNRRLQFKVSL